MNEETLRKLYDAGSEHYTMEEFQVFKTKMSEPEIRQKYYNILSEHYEMVDYETYESEIGTTHDSTLPGPGDFHRLKAEHPDMMKDMSYPDYIKSLELDPLSTKYYEENPTGPIQLNMPDSVPLATEDTNIDMSVPPMQDTGQTGSMADKVLSDVEVPDHIRNDEQWQKKNEKLMQSFNDPNLWPELSPNEKAEMLQEDKKINRFNNFFDDAFAKPWYSTWAGVAKGSASITEALDKYANQISKITGLEKGGLFEDLTKIYNANYERWSKEGINPEDGMMSTFANIIYGGAGQAGVIVPSVMALGKWGLPLYSAGMGGAGAIAENEQYDELLTELRAKGYLKEDEYVDPSQLNEAISAVNFYIKHGPSRGAGYDRVLNPFKTKTKPEDKSVAMSMLQGGVEGALMMGILKTLAGLPNIGARVAGGTTFGAMSAMEGSEPEQVVADILLGGLMTRGSKSSYKDYVKSLKSSVKGDLKKLNIETKLKLKPNEIAELRKVFTSVSKGAKSDQEFIKTLTQSKEAVDLFKGKDNRVSVPLSGKIQAIYNRVVGNPVTKGVTPIVKEKTTTKPKQEVKADPLQITGKPPVKTKPEVKTEPVVKPKPKPKPKVEPKPVIVKPKKTVTGPGNANEPYRTIPGSKGKSLDVSGVTKKAIDINKPAIPRASTVASLQNISIQDGKAITTDLDTYIITDISDTKIKDNFLIPSGKIKSIKNISDLQYSDGKIKVGNSTIKAGDVSNFPQLPKFDKPKTTARINKDELLQILDEFQPYLSKEDIKPALNHIMVEFKNKKATFVGTDGTKLIRKKIDLDFNGSGKTFIHRTTVNKLIRTLKTTKPEEVLLNTYKTRKADFTEFDILNGQVKVIGRSTRENFPDVKTVIPIEYKKSISIDKKDLISAVQEAMDITGKVKFVDFKIDGNKLKLKAKNKETGEIFESQIKISKTKNNVKPSDITRLVMPVRPEGDMDFTLDAKNLMPIIKKFPYDKIDMMNSGQKSAIGIKGALSKKTKINKKLSDKVGSGLSTPLVDKPLPPKIVRDERQMPISLDNIKNVKPISAKRVAKELGKRFDVTIRGKSLYKMGNALGWYMSHSKFIRVRGEKELGTYIHEVAHYIDDRVIRLKHDNRWKEWHKELGPLDYQPNRKNAKLNTMEGFAEYMRYFMQGEPVWETAPKFSKWFENEARNTINPKTGNPLWTDLMDFREYFTRFRLQGSENRIIQNVNLPKSILGKIKDVANRTLQSQFKMAKFKQWVLDDLSVLEQSLKDAGLTTELTPSQNPVEIARMVKGKAGAMAREMIVEGTFDILGKKTGPGLQEIMKPVGELSSKLTDKFGKKNKIINEFIAYWYAKRAEVTWSQKKDPGISLLDARKVISDVESSKKKGEIFKEAVDELTEWSTQVLDYMAQAQVMSPDAILLLRENNPVYMPLQRVFDDLVKMQYRGKGSGGGWANAKSTLRKMTGSQREIQDPFSSLAKWVEQSILQANKNRVAKALAKLSNIEDMGHIIHKVHSPIGIKSVKTEEAIQKLIDSGTINIESLEDFNMELAPDVLNFFYAKQWYGGKENVIGVSVNKMTGTDAEIESGLGKLVNKTEFYEVNADVYKSIMNLDQAKMPFFLDFVLGKPARLLRAGATGLNPTFSFVTNTLRDAMVYTIQSATKLDIKDPKTWPTIKGFTAPIYGIIQDQRNPATVKRWRRAGGELNTILGQDLNINKSLRDEIFIADYKDKVICAFRHPLDMIRTIMSIPEKGPRIAEFETALKQNQKKVKSGEWTEEDAYIDAFNKSQDVTVNFTRMGELGKYLNPIIAFWNANLQGQNKFYRTWKKNMFGTILKASGSLTTLALLSWNQNKDKEWYKELSAWEKGAYFWFDIGKLGGLTNEEVLFRLPKPYDWGFAFATIPEMYMNKLSNEKDNKLYKDLTKEYAEGITPGVIPTALAPLTEIWKNRSWTGRPIIRKSLEDKAPELQFDHNTSQLYKELGKTFKISPIKMQYMANAYTGGLSRLITDAMENTSSLYKVDEFIKIPVLNTFVEKLITPEKRLPSRSIELFYEEYEKLRSKKDTFKGSIRNPKTKTLEKTPKMLKLKKMERIARKLSKSWVKIREAKTKEELYKYYEELDEKLNEYREMK